MYPFLSEFSVDKNTRTGLRSDEIWNKNGTLKQQIDQQESKDKKKTDRPKKTKWMVHRKEEIKTRVLVGYCILFKIFGWY